MSNCWNLVHNCIVWLRIHPNPILLLWSLNGQFWCCLISFKFSILVYWLQIQLLQICANPICLPSSIIDANVYVWLHSNLAYRYFGKLQVCPNPIWLLWSLSDCTNAVHDLGKSLLLVWSSIFLVVYLVLPIELCFLVLVAFFGCATCNERRQVFSYSAQVGIPFSSY